MRDEIQIHLDENYTSIGSIENDPLEDDHGDLKDDHGDLPVKKHVRVYKRTHIQTYVSNMCMCIYIYMLHMYTC